MIPHDESNGLCNSNNPCEANQTCCNSLNGSACCPVAGACCCGDGQTCCGPNNGQTMVCECTGTCPGTACICSGCIPYIGSKQPQCNGVGPEAPLQPFQCMPNCKFNQTCCLDQNFAPHCCDGGSNPVCCGFDAPVCCPRGWACDTIYSNCVPPLDSQPDCEACINFITGLATADCESIDCSILPPPEDSICGVLIDDLGLCPDIVKWLGVGYLATEVCLWTQFCAGETCSCGYCNPMSLGRCLSLPNICPNSKAKLPPKRPPNPHPLVCFDGTCDSDSFGCCLTCF